MNNIFYDIRNNPFSNIYRSTKLSAAKLEKYDELINSEVQIDNMLEQVQQVEDNETLASEVVSKIEDIRTKRHGNATLIDILKHLIEKYKTYKTATESFIGH